MGTHTYTCIYIYIYTYFKKMKEVDKYKILGCMRIDGHERHIAELRSTSQPVQDLSKNSQSLDKQGLQHDLLQVEPRYSNPADDPRAKEPGPNLKLMSFKSARHDK